MFDATATNFGAIPRPAFGRTVHQRPAAPVRTKLTARYQQAARTASELLPQLPDTGEAIHSLMIGTFDLMQVITATVGRLPRCTHLRIATLCYNKRNAVEMLTLLDSQQSLRLTLLVSSFFRSHNKELHEWFAGEVAACERARLAAARSHAKVVCFDLGESDGLVFEGSANLRTNGNREQLTTIRDRQLHDWHAGWIDQMVNTDGEGIAG